MIFDRYLFKNLLIATLFTAFTLTAVIFLTQSLRFLELVIQSGASGLSFWILTILALPRFFEIILPIALMAGCLFIYSKMIQDSEISIMRAAGSSPLMLSRAALVLTAITTLVLWFMTMWLGPVSLAGMQNMRQVIKAEYSSLLVNEGVFNPVAPGLTVYLRERARSGEMLGIMIHDTRKKDAPAVTVLAKRGVIVVTPDSQQVIVYDGSRQSVDPETGTLNRLDFARYTIDFPEARGVVRQRWREPDERTFLELLRPDPLNQQDVDSRRAFYVEAHRRLVSPLLAPAFVMIALSCLLLGPIDRRGQAWRIVLAVTLTIALQGLYLAAFNLSRQSAAGLVLMYLTVFVPLLAGLFLLSSLSEKLRARLAAMRARHVKRSHGEDGRKDDMSGNDRHKGGGA